MASAELPVNPVPEEVQLRVTCVALVVLQLVVYGWPAKSVEGDRCTVIVGGGATVVTVSTYVLLPPAPVAVHVHVVG